MVYYRRKFSKFPKKKRATTYKRKRVYSRKLSKFSKPSKIYIHTSKTDLDVITVNGGSSYLNSYVFRFNQSKDYGQLANCFDEYKILAVSIRFSVENRDSQVGVGAVHGNIYSAIDYNDDNAPTINDIESYKSCKVTNGPRMHIRSFVPKPQQSVYNGGITSAYTSMFPQWLPTQYDSVPHYALKFAIQGGDGALGTGISMVVKPIITYKIAFRGPR